MIVDPWRQQWHRLHHKRFNAPRSIQPANHSAPSEWQHVLITGWYGTETAGDKAILGELLHFLKTYSPGCRVTLTTLDGKVSQQTKLELAELKGITLVDMDKAYTPALIESVDAVIIGGGPLEEIPQTEYIWRMFVEANRQRKARIIFGCGVGSLYSERLRQMVSAICQMTTAGFLRDEESREYAIGLGGSESLGCACDPALAYVQRWAANFQCHYERSEAIKENKPLRIAGLVRANTNEYIVDMDRTELKEFNAQTARQIAQILESVCQKYQVKVDLLPMHSIWVGGDDRIFNRQVAGFFSNPDAVQVERRYLPLETLLQSLYLVDAAVAMRYHGHLFCMALGMPFLSIDYTGKPGKVHSLIQRIGYQQWSEEWRNIDVVRAASRLQQLLEERSHWSAYLQ
jgi:polysaccharide pyruvyl transferase WcaK-like protein